MASIRVRVSQGRRVVTVYGPLAAADLRRLERACGPALEHPDAPLEIRMRDVSTIDEASRFYLERLVQRGAIVL